MTTKNEEIKLKEIKTYHDKEETKIREHYFVNEKGKEHGIYQAWHENGKLWREWYSENGEGHGVCKTYYENGDLQCEWNFEKGKLHGVLRRWYKNSDLWLEEHYEKGKLISDKIY